MHAYWEWVVSPNHNEILVDRPRTGSWDDLYWDWRISPNHNEIVVAGPARDAERAE